VSDLEIGKKMVEEMELEPFLDEYAAVTGRKLEVLGRSERPDFICRRGREPYLGLELVKVIEDPISRQWEEILNGSVDVDPLDTAIHLQEAVYRKEDKRKIPGWRCPARTILVLQLMEAPAEEVGRYLDIQILDEMSATGFLEIWAADYTVFEPYGTVELLGIKPRKWRGIHRHRLYGTKPYG